MTDQIMQALRLVEQSKLRHEIEKLSPTYQQFLLKLFTKAVRKK